MPRPCSGPGSQEKPAEQLNAKAKKYKLVALESFFKSNRHVLRKIPCGSSPKMIAWRHLQDEAERHHHEQFGCLHYFLPHHERK